MNKKYLGRAIILCLFIFLILLALLTEVNCKPISAVPARLVLHAPIIWISYNGGMPCMYGSVTNVGGGTAYNGRLYISANGGEREYVILLGDIDPGETISVEEYLEGYTFADDVRCTYWLDWDNERLLVCVDMESARVSYGD